MFTVVNQQWYFCVCLLINIIHYAVDEFAGLVESDLPHGFTSLYSYVDLLKAEMKKDKKWVTCLLVVVLLLSSHG